MIAGRLPLLGGIINHVAVFDDGWSVDLLTNKRSAVSYRTHLTTTYLLGAVLYSALVIKTTRSHYQSTPEGIKSKTPARITEATHHRPQRILGDFERRNAEAKR